MSINEYDELVGENLALRRQLTTANARIQWLESTFCITEPINEEAPCWMCGSAPKHNDDCPSKVGAPGQAVPDITGDAAWAKDRHARVQELQGQLAAVERERDEAIKDADAMRSLRRRMNQDEDGRHCGFIGGWIDHLQSRCRLLESERDEARAELDRHLIADSELIAGLNKATADLAQRDRTIYELNCAVQAGNRERDEARAAMESAISAAQEANNQATDAWAHVSQSGWRIAELAAAITAWATFLLKPHGGTNIEDLHEALFDAVGMGDQLRALRCPAQPATCHCQGTYQLEQIGQGMYCTSCGLFVADAGPPSPAAREATNVPENAHAIDCNIGTFVGTCSCGAAGPSKLGDELRKHERYLNREISYDECHAEAVISSNHQDDELILPKPEVRTGGRFIREDVRVAMESQVKNFPFRDFAIWLRRLQDAAREEGLAAGYAEAIEQAAKEADAEGQRRLMGPTTDGLAECRKIAKAIRKLAPADKEPK